MSGLVSKVGFQSTFNGGLFFQPPPSSELGVAIILTSRNRNYL